MKLTQGAWFFKSIVPCEALVASMAVFIILCVGEKGVFFCKNHLVASSMCAKIIQY
jgi:hypothetical protein